MHQFVWKWNPKWARFSYYYYTTTTTNTPGSIFWATFFILCLSPPKNGLLPEGIPCMKLLQTRCDLLMMMCCKFYTPQIHRRSDKNNNIHYFWIMNAFFNILHWPQIGNWIAILFKLKSTTAPPFCTWLFWLKKMLPFPFLFINQTLP